jgi:hypothetical protein
MRLFKYFIATFIFILPFVETYAQEAYLIRDEVLEPESKSLVERAEIPYLKGESRQIFEAKPSPDIDEYTWFTNDHCFITDKDGQLHWFGINNPYPMPEGKKNNQAGMYRYHPYLGHLTSNDAENNWKREDFAINEFGKTDYVGAPYVIWHEESKRYAMVVEVWPDERELEIYWSGDLYNWEASGNYILPDLLWNSTRDPHILKGDDGKYWIHVVSDTPDHFDFYNNTVTTLFGHAAEIFTYKGIEYITSCGPEDAHMINHQSVSVAELGWLKQ